MQVTVIGLVDGAGDGPALVAAGADALEVPDAGLAAALRAQLDVGIVAPDPAIEVADDAAALAVAIVGGARVVRTHDVRAARRVADVLAAVVDAAGRP